MRRLKIARISGLCLLLIFSDRKKVVSIDAQNTALEAIDAGEIDATVVYPIVMQMGILVAAKILVGEAIPRNIELDAPIITKENVKEFLGKTGT